MPRRKKDEPHAPSVATGVSFPTKTPQRPPNDIGVKAVRRPDHGGERPRTMGGFIAAEACELFGRPSKGGGEAFLRWLATEHPEVKSTARMSAEEWQPLLSEFADRPIHGHRRTSRGGNHRINKQHRR